MNCTAQQYAVRLLQAYTRLRTECCSGGGYSTLSTERCVTEIIKRCYFDIIAMMSDPQCADYTETQPRPDPPYPSICRIGDEDWLESVVNWAEGIRCSEQPTIECFELADYYWRAPPQSVPDVPPCLCDASRTWQSITGDPSILQIGPYEFNVELFAGSDVFVDDDLVINGEIIGAGEFTEGAFPCTECNTNHTFTAGRVFAMLEAGQVANVTVCDQQGVNIGAEGQICVRRRI